MKAAISLVDDVCQTKVFAVNLESTFSADNRQSGVTTKASYVYPFGLMGTRLQAGSALFPADTTSSTIGPVSFPR